METGTRDDQRESAPIGDYALLSDSQGAALVSRRGSIDWACLPRFDSPAIFARLVGHAGGHWRVAPAGPARVERAYLEGTMVLRTVFHTAGGSVSVTDAMPFGLDEREHRIGRRSPHAIVRVVEGLSGSVEFDVEFAPRPEYGLTTPLLVPHSGGLRTRGGPQVCILSSPTSLAVDGGTARGRLSLRAGTTAAFALRVCSPWEEMPGGWTESEIVNRLDATVASWRSWSGLHQRYEGPYADLVGHSGRVLQALTYAPSGAIVAAPTTSLPEALGGSRNWDYRFCWVRDASLTLEALWVAACPDEAKDYFDFFVTASGGRGNESGGMQVLYGVEGERAVHEHELSHLEGYRGSRPVRVGNGAWGQAQLDVYGELLVAADLLAEQVGEFDEPTSVFLVDLAETAARRWKESDQGIWELRGEPRPFLHSKVLCWAALDRAVRLAPRLRAERHVERWRTARDHIRATIMERGWSEEAGAFTQAFGSHELDASVLLMPIVGFLPADDPRMRATIEAVAHGLADQCGLIYRYRAEDGLPGEEGVFAICTYWLVQCLAMLGETDRARKLFDTMTGHANDVGLLSEEVDPASGELLGNFPQAFAHVGLVNAAWAIVLAERKSGRDAQQASDDVGGRRSV